MDIILRIGLAVAALFTWLLATAATEPAQTAASAQYSERLAGRLSNGVRYLFEAPPGCRGDVKVRFVVRTGFLDESQGEAGLSHLIEHLGFAGTAKFPGRSIWNQFAGDDLGASTGWKATIYSLNLSNGRARSPEEIVSLFREWATGMTLDDASLERERLVVLAESSQSRKGDPKLHLLRRFVGSTVPDLRARSEEEDITSMSAARAQSFYRNFYTPDRMSVIVVGDIEPQRWLDALETQFSNLTPTFRKRRFARGEPVLGKANSASFLRKPGRAFEVSAHSFVSVPTASINEDVSLKHEILVKLASELVTQRLKSYDILSKFHPAGAFANRNYIDPTLKYDGIFVVSVLPDAAQIPNWSLYVRQALREMSTDGFSVGEFEAAKLKIRRQVLRMLSSNGFVVDGLYVNAHILDTNDPRRPNKVEIEKTFDSLSLGEVVHFIKERVSLFHDFHVIAEGNFEAEDVTFLKDQTLAAIQGAHAHSLAPLKRNPAPMLISSLAKPQISRDILPSTRLSERVTRIELPSGIPLFLIAGRYQDEGDPLSLAAVSTTGGLSGDRRLSHAYSSLTGTFRIAPAQFDRNATEEYFERVGLGSAILVGPHSFRLSLTGGASEAEHVFDAMRAAVATPKEQVSLHPKAVTGFAPASSLGRASGSGGALPDNDALRLLAPLFEAFSPQAFIMVSDLDAQHVALLASRYLSDLPSTSNIPTGLENRIAGQCFSVPFVSTRLDGDVTIRTYEVATFIDEINRLELSVIGQIASSRMEREMKDRLGMVYYFGAGAQAASLPDSDGKTVVHLELRYKSDEKDREILLGALDKISADIERGVFSDGEFKSAKAILSTQMENSLISRADLTDRATRSFLMAGTLRQISDAQEILNRITLEGTRHTARSLLSRIATKAPSCV